jgi:hypothetical protein
MVSPDLVGASDPYAGQEDSPFYYNPFVFICGIIALFKPDLGNWLMGYFPPHNYRQWHVMEIAFWAGFDAPSRDSALGKLIFPAIPKCPDMWLDVQHYWMWIAAAGILVYEILANIRILVVVFVLFRLVTAGEITAEVAYRTILGMLGVTI